MAEILQTWRGTDADTVTGLNDQFPYFNIQCKVECILNASTLPWVVQEWGSRLYMELPSVHSSMWNILSLCTQPTNQAKVNGSTAIWLLVSRQTNQSVIK